MTSAPRDSSPTPYRYLLPGAVVLGIIVACALYLWTYGAAYLAYWSYEPQEGDILFQSLPRSPLVQAIEGATHSPYSHCGLVAKENGGWVVLEALRGVESTPLREFLFRGRNQAFAIYRLKSEQRSHIPLMIENARKFLGREYDIHYDLDEERIYCSELIYKAYLGASGEKLGQLKRLGDLDWRPFQATIERIEGGPVPTERQMITPKHLAEAEQLELVEQFGYGNAKEQAGP